MQYWYDRGDLDRAAEEWTEAITVNPTRGVFYRNRGLMYYHQEKHDLAVNDYTEAIRLEPTDAIAWNNRGAALLKQGEWAKAQADLREAIRIDPDFPNPHRHLAWIQATCPEPEYRNAEEAVANATRALELTHWSQPEWLSVFAAAHAEAGNFEEAVRWQKECLETSPEETRNQLRQQLELYEAGQPFRDDAVAATTS
jgi:tetratricopeptide (TPR) repeat protein